MGMGMGRAVVVVDGGDADMQNDASVGGSCHARASIGPSAATKRAQCAPSLKRCEQNTRRSAHGRRAQGRAEEGTHHVLDARRAREGAHAAADVEDLGVVPCVDEAARSLFATARVWQRVLLAQLLFMVLFMARELVLVLARMRGRVGVRVLCMSRSLSMSMSMSMSLSLGRRGASLG